MVYAITFSLSVALIYYSSSKQSGSVLKKQISFTEILAIILLTIVAGGRAATVGTDVMTYVNYEFAANRSFSSLTVFLKSYYLEIGYEFISFFVSRFSDDVHWVYFANALIIIIGIYSGIRFFSKSMSISLAFSMIIFLLCFYNNTLNAIRQSMSMAILFGFSKYLIERRPFRYLLGVVLAISMHSAGLIGMVIYILYGILLDTSRKRSRRILVIGAIIVGIISLPVICQIAMNVGILPVRFARYFSDNALDKGGPLLAFSKLPILAAGLCAVNRKTFQKDLKPLVIFTLIEFLLALLRIRFGAVSRLADYFGIYNTVMLPAAISTLFKKQKVMVYSLVIILLVLYWVYCILIKNYGETMPYIWDWRIL